jgi:hypothetical protein
LHASRGGEREKLFRDRDIRAVVQPLVDPQHCARIPAA